MIEEWNIKNGKKRDRRTGKTGRNETGAEIRGG